MKAGAMVAVCALALTGCAGEDAEYTQFCETSRTLTDMTDQIDTLVPDPEALTDARDGDFTALNTWGEEAQVSVANVGSEFQAARDAAPDEDLSAALDTYLAMLDLFQQTAIAGASAVDAVAFTVKLEDLETQAADLSEDLTTAGAVLSTTQQNHCE